MKKTQAGIVGKNISIKKVISNILKLKSLGYNIKINTMLIKGFSNKKDIKDLLNFTQQNDLILGICDYFGENSKLYIEPISYMKKSFKATTIENSYSLAKIKIQDTFVIIQKYNCNPHKKVKKYCKICSKKDEMRVTPFGALKPCYINNNENIDTKNVINNSKKLKKAFELARNSRLKNL